MWGLATTAVGSVALAQPAASANQSLAKIELSYEAFAGCPEREVFAENLDARRRGAVGSRSAVQLEVRLRPLEGSGRSAEPAPEVEGSIVVKSERGVPSARRIVAATCGEAADALAWIAALALQQIDVAEAPADDARAGRATGEPRSPRSADRPRPPDPSEAEPPPAIATESQAALKAPVETESKAAPLARERPRDRASSDAAPQGVAEGPRPTEFRAYALLGGATAAGVLPRVQPLLDLSLSLEHGAQNAMAWSALAAFRIGPDQTRHLAQGAITLGFWSGLLAGCLGARGAQLSARACACFELGALSASATDTERPRSVQRAWAAVGPALALGYDITPALRVEARAEVLTPLTRYRLELPRGTAVHEPLSLGLRGGLGVGLRLE